MKSLSIREVSGGYIIAASEPIDFAGLASAISNVAEIGEDMREKLEQLGINLSKLGTPSSTREIVAKDKEDLLQKVTAIIGSW